MPEWINLLPAGAARTVDGRGPYTVASMAALIAASLQDGQKLPLDENHATDKGAVLGLPAPARGWIVALEAREDGLWGKVE
ncbi:phage protease, partial [Escherichia coli]|uniref:phage protease n=1 Tax=Escherichia coli TaxID=562 RepID=UPI003D36398A